MNGHAQVNGYSSTTQYAHGLHQLPPPRTHALQLTKHSKAKNDLGSAAPASFFKDSPFYDIRELVLGNITLEGMSTTVPRPQLD